MTTASPYFESRMRPVRQKPTNSFAEECAILVKHHLVRFNENTLGSFFTSTDEAALLKNIARLREFSAAKVNWNGYGAEPFNEKALHNAYSIITQKLKNQPFITPLTDGGVQLNWRNKDREFEVEVYASYYKWANEQGQEDKVSTIEEVIAAYEQWGAANS
jgi:hypothetical protein